MSRCYSHIERHPEYGGLLRRHPDNPVFRPKDWPYPANAVFNPGAVRLHESGETLLLVRVEGRRGHSHLCAARSMDGICNWRIDPAPTLAPDRDKRPEEMWGIGDPRITWVPELRQYAVVYTAYSRGGPGVALAMTRDFARFDHYGMIIPPDDKDAALFPRRFGGHWSMIHRPNPASGDAHIWISFSPDLRHWGSHMVMTEAREGGWWDAHKEGLSPPPIETPEGWLLLYHGVRMTASGCLYRTGLALLDLDNPVKVIRRVEDDGDTLRIYYGGADTCVCLATASIRELLDWLRDHDYPGTG